MRACGVNQCWVRIHVLPCLQVEQLQMAKSLNRTGKSDLALADSEGLAQAELGAALADHEAEAKRAMAVKLEEHAAQVSRGAGRGADDSLLRTCMNTSLGGREQWWRVPP
jgi:hypothetical protein